MGPGVSLVEDEVSLSEPKYKHLQLISLFQNIKASISVLNKCISYYAINLQGIFTQFINFKCLSKPWLLIGVLQLLHQLPLCDSNARL